MRLNILFIIFLLLNIILAGCARTNSGTVAIGQNPEKLKQLRVNKSTKESVTKLLGEPQSITTFDDESECWVYESTQTDYTDVYVAKKALGFVPVPYLGTAVGFADVGPEKIKATKAVTLTFNKNGLLKQMTKSTKQN